MVFKNVFRRLFKSTSAVLRHVNIQIGLKVKISIRGGVDFSLLDTRVKDAKNIINLISPIKNASIRKVYYFQSPYSRLKLKRRNLNVCLTVSSELRGYKRLKKLIEELLKLRALNLLFRKNNMDIFSMGIISVEVVNTYVKLHVQNFHFFKFFFSNLNIRKLFNRTFFIYIYTDSREEAEILGNFLKKLFS